MTGNELVSWVAIVAAVAGIIGFFAWLIEGHKYVSLKTILVFSVIFCEAIFLLLTLL